METTKESYPSVRPGITVENGTSSALVWAPDAVSVEIVTDKSLVISLGKTDFGYWCNKETNLKQGDSYKIRINGKKTIPDPASLCQPEGVHGFSRVVDLSQYTWSDRSWKGIGLDEMIIYELHAGTFSAKGDFRGISERLDYLVDLGINAIELMPVAQFPGKRNWGYDGVFPYAVQNSYGGASELQKLVDACHNKGITVILDVVYNHMGPEGNYLGCFGPYFTQKYETPWGDAINFDDAGSHGVRHFFIQNALMWMRDFHIDGLRLDAVHAIKDSGALHFLQELNIEVENLNRKTGKNHFLIGECDLNDVRYINPIQSGGYALNAQWCDEFHHALHSMVTGEQNGYYSDFGGVDPVVKTLKNAYVYNGNYSRHRDKFFGSKTDGQCGSKFVVFSQNHDQIGNRMNGDRLSHLVGFENLKLIAGFTILSPYVPLIFMGEEYGENAPFLYFTHHGDKDLIEAVRKGRANEFKEFMSGDGEIPYPQAEDTFNRSKLTNWNQINESQRLLHRFYKALIQLRKSDFDFSPRFSRANIEVSNEGELVILRKNKIISGLDIYFNFSDERVKRILEENTTFQSMVFCSSSEQWGGSQNEALIHTPQGYELNLPGFSFCVIRKYNSKK
ncbi:malto-oligosyltrehalose trehalohydrolase [Alkalitalea saponilacus]|uniref:Malto-oligosyltrehalose trehalohydrolase n=1 Tax=Alkalitalea saponilacus TaxID=889453 RepID=A0A1T5F8T2_9BACT|nr:malto-oligosyltrehalose trehalohydrolase [Alkalitalea saponilacus]ASB50126.1 malto-oligosyltrehalose trehalohydrolase [Alkalitalea saponilacus]SKB92544.1 maltooligosyltrehalose trehalohydrolase [Alkalitalea saponilacus]